MPRSLDRRRFITRSAAAGAGFYGVLSLARAAAAAAKPGNVANTATAPAPAWPIWDHNEEKALLDVLQSGKWGRTSGGTRVREFETAFSNRMRARYCLATASGTTALVTSLGALGVGPGDEAILPPYTFVATFNAVTLNYALPVFVDTDPATFQIDATKIAGAITPATKVILPVHIGGSSADLDAISELSKTRNIAVVEDACQAHLAEWQGRPVGTAGIGGCFSFQASKNITAGEGGAIVTNDENFANLCYNFHMPGGGRPAPSSGRGSNFRLTEFQAGVLLAQFGRLEEQAETRDANATLLTELLTQIPGIMPARLTPGCTRSAWHLYMFRYDKRHFSNLPRAKFLQTLAQEGIGAMGGYSSLNNSAHVKALATNPHYQRIYGRSTMLRWLERNQCPVNDQLVEEAIWLTHAKLLASRNTMERIADVIRGVQRRAAELARRGP